MKKITLLTFLLALTVAGYSQNSFYNNSYEARNSGSFSQETSLVSFGIGFPNLAVNNYSFGITGSSSGVPPLYVKYEHGFLRDEVGLGGHLSTAFGSYDYSSYKTKIFAWSIGVRAYYHFNKLIPVEKLDVYAGAGLSMRNRSYKYDDGINSDDNDFTIGFDGVVGARYYFSDTFAAYAETGYDYMSSINLGITLRLGK